MIFRRKDMVQDLNGSQQFTPFSSEVADDMKWISQRDLPILPVYEGELTKTQIKKIDSLVGTILSENIGLVGSQDASGLVATGVSEKPAILIGDKSEIHLLPPTGANTQENRFALLAAQGDLVVVSNRPSIDFRDYLSNILDTSLQPFLHAALPGNGIAWRCAEDPVILEKLVNHTKKHGGTSILCHIATSSIWNLAELISTASKLPVNVVGPHSELVELVNNKLWFAELVKKLLGPQFVPAEWSAGSPEELTKFVQEAAKSSHRIVVKVPDSAGSMGNFPIQSDVVNELEQKILHETLQDMIGDVVTENDYPLIVEVWDDHVVHNPSVQMWIPMVNDGPPVIEGLFDQVVEGPEGKFAGAVSAQLSVDIEQKLCVDAMQLATLFQKLGYFGRCSFDAVVIGSNDDEDNVHWIECNGRWGGVSIPMTFVNRLFPDGKQPAFAIVQRTQVSFNPISFKDALVLLGDQLFVPNPHNLDIENVGIVLTTTSGLEQGNGIHLVAFGLDENDAIRRAEKAVRTIQAS
jgi:hypothetical protein